MNKNIKNNKLSQINLLGKCKNNQNDKIIIQRFQQQSSDLNSPQYAEIRSKIFQNLSKAKNKSSINHNLISNG